MPSIIKHLTEKTLIEPDEGVPELLKTIRVPKNIHYLTEKLPKPNYIPIKYRRSTIGSMKSLENSMDAKVAHNSSNPSLNPGLDALPSIKKGYSNEDVLERLLKKQVKRKKSSPQKDKLGLLDLEVSGKQYNHKLDMYINKPAEDILVLPKIQQAYNYQNSKIREIRDVYKANYKANIPKTKRSKNT
jgi:hypothetical protein